MEQLLQEWDGEALVIRFDQPTSAWMIVAIHSTKLGPATGGTRMKSYPDLMAAVLDAQRLSSAMTYKLALAGFDRGGGKAVISMPKELGSKEREALLRRYGFQIQQLGGLFQAGPDSGLSAEDMDIIAEMGGRYVFGRTEAAGGVGDTGKPTALGVFAGMEMVCQHLFGAPSLVNKVVLVQGAGSVGGHLIEMLLEAGAEVLFSEADETIVDQIHNKHQIKFVSPKQVYETPCDIFAPCALGGVLNQETIPRLACKAVAGAANNQLSTAADSERLRQKQILYAPDFVISSGAGIAIDGLELQGWEVSKVNDRITNSIKDVLKKILELATSESITTEEAAKQIAERRLSMGTGWRREKDT
jgi:leucine dehydrogenase